MQTSNSGIDEIKESEGLRLRAYNTDGAGVWTIGYGHTGPVDGQRIRNGMIITEPKAVQLLREDLREAEEAVTRLVKVPLAQHQFDALVSFTFNLGETKFKNSTLLRELNRSRYDSVPAQLMRWTKAKDPATGAMRDLPGLVTRRRLEAAMWRGLATQPAAAPAPASVQPEEAPQPTRPSDTAVGGGAVAGGGIIAVIETFPALRDALKRTLDTVGLGEQVTLILGGSIAVAAGWLLFTRWKEAGYPLPWKR